MEERQCLVFNRMGRASLAEKEIVEQRPEEGEGAGGGGGEEFSSRREQRVQRSCGENVSGTNAARRLLCLEKSERGGGQRRNTASDPIRAAAPVRTGAHEARGTVWRPKVPRSARLEMEMAMTTAMWHDGVTRTPGSSIQAKADTLSPSRAVQSISKLTRAICTLNPC